MSAKKNTKEETARAVYEKLQRAARHRERYAGVKGLTPQQQMLAAWQAQRLAATYADLMAQKRYQAAVEFFLSDLYGPHDFSGRDRNIEQVYPIMARVLSEHALRSIGLGIELHALSQELDDRLLEVLTSELGVVNNITPELYAEAYRRCDNHRERLRQIELLEAAGRALNEMVFKPAIYTAVRLARKPAKMAGFGELQSFVERGLFAFRQMRGAEEFLHTVVSRERALLDAIYAGDASAPPPRELTLHVAN